MAGLRSALNLRELEERVAACPDESLFHHFCETVIRPTFDDPDYPNDFALWAKRYLQDRTLAERLAVINPYKVDNFAELRTMVTDVIQQRLSEIEYIPWAPLGNAFQFLQAVTVVFDTGIVLREPEDLKLRLPDMSLGSIYYHFVEARRRTSSGEDDFTAWLADFGDSTAGLRAELHGIDFYFMPLWQLAQTLSHRLERN